MVGERVVDRLENVMQTIAMKYSTEDGSCLEQPNPGTDALDHAHALIPTLKEDAERKWKKDN